MEITRPQRVFIDANTWISWGHELNKAEASTLEDLIDHGFVKVVVTDLTINEVAKKFRNNDFDKLEPFTRPDLRHTAKEHLGLDFPEVDKIELRQSLFDHHYKNVERALRGRFRAEVRSIDEVKPTDVLKDYTHGAGLFGPSAKKDQFPDAFIFAAIGQAATKDEPLLVLSKDGDFAKACEEAPHIHRVDSLPRLLEALGIAPEDDELISTIEEDIDLFQEPLAELLADTFLDAEDVEDAEIEFVKLIGVKSIEVKAMYRIGEKEQSYIGFGKASADIEVRYSHPDWESAYWDGEDKVAIPHESVEGTSDVVTDDFLFSFLVQIEKDAAPHVYNCEVREPWGITVTLYPQDHYY
jgi:hypothetical protein